MLLNSWSMSYMYRRVSSSHHVDVEVASRCKWALNLHRNGYIRNEYVNRISWSRGWLTRSQWYVLRGIMR